MTPLPNTDPEQSGGLFNVQRMCKNLIKAVARVLIEFESIPNVYDNYGLLCSPGWQLSTVKLICKMLNRH